MIRLKLSSLFCQVGCWSLLRIVSNVGLLVNMNGRFLSDLQRGRERKTFALIYVFIPSFRLQTFARGLIKIESCERLNYAFA